jgi:hypothetical protein
MFGYPEDVPHGMWVRAEVAGPASENQLVQLNVVPGGPRLEPGFSGTAVIDDGTGEIIGMIRAYDRGVGGACWMIPIDAVIKHVPLVSGYAFGPSTDPEFSVPRRRPDMDAAGFALLEALAAWLFSDSPGGICVVAGERTTDLLNLLVRPGGYPAVLPAGARGVDVAVDAARKTTEQVSRQLATGLGSGDDPGTDVADLVSDLGIPAAVVVDSVDAASQPTALLGRLLELVSRSPRPAVRLLLGFRG